jgi:hypothetical protein
MILIETILFYVLGVPSLVALGYWLCWRRHQGVITTAQQQAMILEDAIKQWEKLK